MRIGKNFEIDYYELMIIFGFLSIVVIAIFGK